MSTPEEVSPCEDAFKRVRSSSSQDSTNGRAEMPASEFGFRPFPKRGGIVTNELIDRLRNEAGV